MTITAAADGSALGNPGPNGWAWYIDDENWAAGGSPHGTNNQGELRAVLELLLATAGTDEKLLIECDSRYVIDSVTKWMPGWKRKGWRKSDGGPVLNRDLLEGIDEAIRGRNVEFSWVKGHAGHPAERGRRRARERRGQGLPGEAGTATRARLHPHDRRRSRRRRVGTGRRIVVRVIIRIVEHVGCRSTRALPRGPDVGR